MAELRESVTIAAPAERVWEAVHEDMRNFTRWTTNVTRAAIATKPPVGEGTVYRYSLDTPIGTVELELENTEWRKPRLCAGEYVSGPVAGSWCYAYSERAGKTRLVYESEYHLTGVLRLLTGRFAPHYEAGVRQNLKNLKAFLEAG